MLLHSFVDLKTHEFFFERDYPAEELLAKIQKAIPKDGTTLSELSARAKVTGDTFEKGIEKLWVHGGALVAPDDTVTRGTGDWRKAYAQQRAHKREQLSRMRRYGETASCRMLQLVAHFGDQNDAGQPCGLCDVCVPTACIAQVFRAPSATEVDASARILAALREYDGRSVGQIQRDVLEGALERRSLEHVLGAMARAGEIRIVADEFVKDGETIAFQRVHLASGGGGLGGGALRMVAMPEARARRGKKTSNRASRSRRTSASASTSTSANTSTSTSTRKRGSRTRPGDMPPLEGALRAWRMQEAKKRRVPAFRILTDRTLLGIASACPRTTDQLLGVAGMGPTLVQKYGQALLAIVSR